MARLKGMKIGNARVILRMSAPNIETIISQGHSLITAVTTAYVYKSGPKRKELTVSPDDTLCLTQEASTRLKELRIYTDQEGSVFITDGDIGEVEGYECLGQLNPEVYAASTYILLEQDDNESFLRQKVEEQLELIPTNAHPDCPCWRNNRCMYEPKHPTSCSLPSHIPYTKCALEPEKAGASGQAGRGCLVMLLLVILPVAGGLLYLIWHMPV